MDFLKKNAIMIGILVVSGIGLIWYFGSRGGRAEDTLVATGPLALIDPFGPGIPGAQMSLVDQVGIDIIQILGQLDAIKLDVSLFQNPAFTILKQSEEIVPAPVPRRGNPFAPIGSRAATTPTNTPATN